LVYFHEPIDQIGKALHNPPQSGTAMTTTIRRSEPDIRRNSKRDGVQEIRAYILETVAQGALGPGGKLPTERELSTRFALPRNTIRKTLAQLEAEGAITRHVGRGTFLADSGGFPAGSISHTSPAELMEARLRLEPTMAELIVINATPADFERMETCLDRAERGTSLNDFEVWDAALHQALAAATHNRFMIRVFDMATAVRHQTEWGKLKDRVVTAERRLKYQEEHRAIVEALKARDADRARAAILTHLQHARSNLFGF